MIRRILSFALVALTYNASAWAQFQAGFSKKDITPPDALVQAHDVRMSGYTPGRLATGVHDPLYARAMVVSESGAAADSIALAIIDATGISNRMIAAIRKQVETETGIPGTRIWVGATHSHSSPDFQGLWGGTPAAYRTDVIRLTADAISQAFRDRQNATLWTSSTTHSNGNRRGWPISDQEVSVLQAKDRDGKILGTLVNFAAHPVLISSSIRLLSRDFPGYTVDEIEKQIGGIAIYANGIVGDVTPRHKEADFEGAKSYGESIAQRALESLPLAKRVRGSGIEASNDSWFQKISNNMFLIAKALGYLDYDLRSNPGLKFDIEVRPGYFRIGEGVQAVAFPGESLTRLGLPIKQAMKTEARFFLGLTGDTLGYFVPKDEWKTGLHKDYEESMSLDETAGEKAKALLLGLIAKDEF